MEYKHVSSPEVSAAGPNAITRGAGSPRLSQMLQRPGARAPVRQSIRSWRLAATRAHLSLIVGRGRVRSVEQKVWTAAELETLSPTERRALFDASVVTDLDEAPQDLVERTRSRIQQRIASSDAQRG